MVPAGALQPPLPFSRWTEAEGLFVMPLHGMTSECVLRNDIFLTQFHVLAYLWGAVALGLLVSSGNFTLRTEASLNYLHSVCVFDLSL